MPQAELKGVPGRSMHCLSTHRDLTMIVLALRSTQPRLIAAFADMIDIQTQEIKPASDDTYSDVRDLADELPDSSPRFVLLSYPMTMVR